MCIQPALNHHSYANLSEVSFQHLHWVIDIDFARQQLRGFAEYSVEFRTGAAKKENPVVVLDTNHLNIEKAFVDGKEVAFTLRKADAVFGSALQIPVTHETKKVKVQYTTTAESSGLQWLSKELTAGKTHPYLFTQCQAIHARSIVPCPDTPACKFTYTATVTVPDWCTALLSAIAADKPKAGESTGTHSVTFHQEVPIPSYLLAIAAGKLESKEIGPRSRVWAEASVVDKAAFEFSQTEEFLKYAEEITGQEYVWKRYDLVCLPPSFPYGGMENPCLTFVTPTLLAGDRSLADVVAHEISHSWTGNLVTNHTWKDFWLNEGWTMWLERKIAAKIYNDPLAYDLKATMGLRDLKESVEDFGADHPYTHLVPDSDNIDPDDVFSSIPYEKGFNFLNYLTEVVGGRDVFETFAKAYIKHFKFKTLTSEEFQHYFTNYFTSVVNKREAIKAIDWHKWFHTPGMPLVMTKFDTTLTGAATKLGERMAKSADPSTWGSVTREELKHWQTALWVLLLDTLLLEQSERGAVFSRAHLDAIDAFVGHHFTKSGNAELRFRWYTLSLRSQDPRQNANIAAFLGEQGRMKYVRPLFRDLIKHMGKQHAAEIFAKTKGMYHPICAKMVQRDIDEAKQTTVKVTKTTHTTIHTHSSSSGGVFASIAKTLGVREAQLPLVLVVTIGAVATATAIALSQKRRH